MSALPGLHVGTIFLRPRCDRFSRPPPHLPNLSLRLARADRRFFTSVSVAANYLVSPLHSPIRTIYTYSLFYSIFLLPPLQSATFYIRLGVLFVFVADFCLCSQRIVRLIRNCCIWAFRSVGAVFGDGGAAVAGARANVWLSSGPPQHWLGGGVRVRRGEFGRTKRARKAGRRVRWRALNFCEYLSHRRWWPS